MKLKRLPLATISVLLSLTFSQQVLAGIKGSGAENVDVSVSSGGSAAYTSGDIVCYVLTAKNNGIGDALAVTIDDIKSRLPSGVTVLELNTPTQRNSNNDLWEVGDLSAGASTMLNVIVTVD